VLIIGSGVNFYKEQGKSIFLNTYLKTTRLYPRSPYFLPDLIFLRAEFVKKSIEIILFAFLQPVILFLHIECQS
jgi:hypothetical protein